MAFFPKKITSEKYGGEGRETNIEKEEIWEDFEVLGRSKT